MAEDLFAPLLERRHHRRRLLLVGQDGVGDRHAEPLQRLQLLEASAEVVDDQGDVRAVAGLDRDLGGRRRFLLAGRLAARGGRLALALGARAGRRARSRGPAPRRPPAPGIRPCRQRYARPGEDQQQQEEAGDAGAASGGGSGGASRRGDEGDGGGLRSWRARFADSPLGRRLGLFVLAAQVAEPAAQDQLLDRRVLLEEGAAALVDQEVGLQAVVDRPCRRGRCRRRR